MKSKISRTVMVRGTLICRLRTFNCSLKGQGLQWLHLEGMVHGQYVEDPKASACSEEMACGCHPDIDVGFRNVHDSEKVLQCLS